MNSIVDEHDLLRPLYIGPSMNETVTTDIFNVTFGVMSVATFLLLLIPAFILYYGQRAYRLIHILCRYKTWQYRNSGAFSALALQRSGEAEESKFHWQQKL